MTAAESAPQGRFTGSQLTLTGLVLLIIGIAGAGLYFNFGRPSAGNGSDTPIVISGGSIHFRAKKSGWTLCDSNPTSSSTSCYKATFDRTDKAHLKKYQFSNGDDSTAVPVTSAKSAWEIDVVNTDPDNKHMVLVCAESSNFSTCGTGAMTSGSIYVIAKGGGSFEPPTSADPGKLLYDDGNTAYDHIGNIFLNASGGAGGEKETCTDPHCALFLSQ